ncbi:MAG: hypothetical protein ACRDSZ_22205 [Pseudonocardiaceae bacterium]
MRAPACGSPAQWSCAALSNTVEIVSADGPGLAVPGHAAPAPAVAAPAAHDPAAHDPAVLDPAAHDPAAHDPAVLDPAVLDPAWARRRARRCAAAATRRCRFDFATHPPVIGSTLVARSMEQRPDDSG